MSGRRRCLDYAVATYQQDGIWGGAWRTSVARWADLVGRSSSALAPPPIDAACGWVRVLAPWGDTVGISRGQAG